MAGVLVNQGEDKMLGLLVEKPEYALETLTLRLFKNNWTPAEGNDESDATEADFTGYTAVELGEGGGGWTLTPGAPSQATYGQVSFTSSANQAEQNIYGYMLVNTTSGELIIAERFSDGPYPITLNGDIIRVTLTITQA